MKIKLFSVLIFMSMIIPMIFGTWFLHKKRREVRKEMKLLVFEGMAENQSIRLHFSWEESETVLQWEDETEFEYKGQMYDVVRKEVKNDSLYLQVIADHQETFINTQINCLLANSFGNGGNKKNHESRMIDFIKSFYATNNPIYVVDQFKNIKINYLPFLANYQFQFHESAKKPPTKYVLIA